MHPNKTRLVKQAVFRLSCLFVLILIIGITIQYPTEIGITFDPIELSTHVEGNLPSTADSFIENRTLYSKNLINDSSFILSPSNSPWSVVQTPELSTDTSASITNQMGEMDIVGDQNSFIRQYNTINNNSGEWRPMLNPDYPAYPYWYPLNTSGEPSGAYNNFGLDSGGFWAGHKWAESARQTPSIHWVQNVTITDDMSEYKITNANISVIINASVSTNVDVRGDTVGGGPQAVTYDYADFYVKIADLSRTKIYTVAYYRTTNLGAGNPASQQNPVGISTLANRFLTMVPMDDLRFYLTSVLGVDSHNFTIILGIDFLCEDNFGTDYDYWNSLRIKAMNFTFSYEKQIDKSSTIGFEQNGFKIEPDEYPVDATIELNNATLYFDFNCSVDNPSFSSNSRILAFINGYEHTESIYLTSINTTVQSVKNGTGFDVTSLVKSDQILQLKLELYIADDFTLDTDLKLTIDNVNLTVVYTIIERFSPIATSLKAVGTLARTVQWNDSLSVTLNYTEEISRIGITNTDFSVDWLQEWSIEQLGDGLYEITCQTNQTRPNQQYFLDIITPAKGLYLSQQLSIEVNIIGRLTNLNLSLNGIPQTTFPAIQVPIQDALEIWVEYRDTGSQDLIITENTTLIGSSINSSMYEVFKAPTEEYYIFDVDTSKLGIGTHLITVSFNATNFQTQSQQIQVQILLRSFGYLLLINNEDYTELRAYNAIIAESLNISLQIRDDSSMLILTDVTIQILGDLNTSDYEYTYAFTYHQFQLDTVQLGLGIHLFTISITSEIYISESFQLRLSLLSRDLEFNYRVNGTLWTDNTTILGMIEDHLNLTCWWMDKLTQDLITSPNVSLSGISSISYEIHSTSYEVIILIKTENLAIGNHYFTIRFVSPLYAEFSFNFQLILSPRIIAFNITRDGKNYSNLNAFEVPITEILTFQVQLIENATQQNFAFDESMISISGIASSHYSADFHDGYLDLTLNTASLGLGIHAFAFSVEILNYKQISHSYVLTVAQIRTQMRTPTHDLSFSVKPNEEFLCEIRIHDLDFDVDLTGCNVSYYWPPFGSGTLKEIDESGVYQFTFKTNEIGIYTIYISAIKNSFYKIDPIEITLTVIQPVSPTGLPTWTLYIFGTTIGGFVISFIAYQKYFKFPPSIRKIHQLKSRIRRGKSLNLKLPSEKDLFSDAYHSIIRETVSLPK